MSEAVQAEGTIQTNEEVKDWRYGTHLLLDDGGNDLYALRSEDLDLGDYVGQRVTVIGSVDPEQEAGAEGGPALLIVTEVKSGEFGSRRL